jgi:hypothetical protein
MLLFFPVFLMKEPCFWIGRRKKGIHCYSLQEQKTEEHRVSPKIRLCSLKTQFLGFRFDIHSI